MSPELRGVKPTRAIKAFLRAGFDEVRQRGSHAVLRKEGRPLLIIPVHGRELKIGLLRDILKKAGISVERFLELL
jgi:predicted RNA binding protein YcfA (HicA-like mRNA interferase family)